MGEFKARKSGGTGRRIGLRAPCHIIRPPNNRGSFLPLVPRSLLEISASGLPRSPRHNGSRGIHLPRVRLAPRLRPTPPLSSTIVAHAIWRYSCLAQTGQRHSPSSRTMESGYPVGHAYFSRIACFTCANTGIDFDILFFIVFCGWGFSPCYPLPVEGKGRGGNNSPLVDANSNGDATEFFRPASMT